MLSLEELALRPQRTKITIESLYNTVSVEVPQVDLDINEIWEDVLRPALLAHGFVEYTVDSLVK